MSVEHRISVLGIPLKRTSLEVGDEVVFKQTKARKFTTKAKIRSGREVAIYLTDKTGTHDFYALATRGTHITTSQDLRSGRIVKSGLVYKPSK